MGAVAPLRLTLFPPGVPPMPVQPRHSAQQDPKEGHLYEGQEQEVDVTEQGPVQGSQPQE